MRILDPDAINYRATQLTTQAGQLEAAGQALVTSLDNSGWHGNTETTHRATTLEFRSQLDGHAATLRGIAKQLNAHAIWVQKERDELTRIEAEVRHWISQHQHSLVAGPMLSLLQHQLPAPLSPAWRSLQTKMRGFGALL